MHLLISPALAGIRHPWRALGVAALLLALVAPGLTRLRVTTELYKLIPDINETSEGLRLAVEGLARSSTVFALVEAPADRGDELERVAPALAEALEQSPHVRAARFRPAEGVPSTDPLLLFDLVDADDPIWGEIEARLTPAALSRRAAGIKELIASPAAGAMRALLVADPLGLLELLGRHVAGGVRHMGAQREAFVSSDGEALLLLLEPAGEDLGPAFGRALRADLVPRGEAVLREAGLQDASFRLTGAPLHAASVEAATKSDAAVLSVVSAVAVLLLYLGFYRSGGSLLLVLALLPVGVVAALGLGGLLLGELSPLAAGFAAILFGLGVDPAIHLVSRYRELRCELAPDAAASAAVRAVGPAVALAAATSAFALFSIRLLDDGALGQVGLLAGMGLLVNTAVMLWLMPALWVLLGDRLRPDARVGEPAARRVAALLRRHGAVLGPALIVAALLAAPLLSRLDVAVALNGFQLDSLEPARVDAALERHFGVDRGETLVIVRGSDEEAVLRANDLWAGALDRLQRGGALAGYQSLATIHPAAQTAAARRRHSRSALRLEQAVASMRSALLEQGFRPSAFDAALARIEDFAAGQDPAAVGPTPQWLHWFEQGHVGRVDGELRIVTQVFPSGDAVATAAALRAAAPALPAGVEGYVAGKELFERELEAHLERGLPYQLGFYALAVLLALTLYYRRARHVLAAGLPLGLAVGAFFVAHAALGMPITPFTLAALPLLFGVGIDDHVFLLDRYLEGADDPLASALAGAGRAVIVTTLTTLAAFGVLALSRFDALAELGAAVSIALVAAFFSATLVMPLLLLRMERGGLPPRGEATPSPLQGGPH